MIIRYFIKISIQHKVLYYLSEKRVRTVEEGLRRADQICKWSFDVFYYTLSTLSAFYILKDQVFFPSYMGGPENGNCMNLFMDYPRVPDVPYLKTFYLIQCGAHLGTFIHQVFFKLNDPKYYEFVLHHGLALFLIIFSYLMNMTLVGVVVLFLHDPCDVLLILGRAYTDYKFKNIYLNVFIAAVAYFTWILFRNIFYPICVLRSCFNFYFTPRSEDLDNIVSATIAYQTGMLTVLAIMQFYWTMFLTKGAISMLSKGKDKNGYDS